jgi:hypothetical protein
VEAFKGRNARGSEGGPFERDRWARIFSGQAWDANQELAHFIAKMTEAFGERDGSRLQSHRRAGVPSFERSMRTKTQAFSTSISADPYLRLPELSK